MGYKVSTNQLPSCVTELTVAAHKRGLKRIKKDSVFKKLEGDGGDEASHGNG